MKGERKSCPGRFHLASGVILMVLLFISLFSLSAAAMQNPWEQNWKVIDTGTYKIIFPAENIDLGQRVANMMEYYRPHLHKTIKTRARKIPIVLVNQYAAANGFVSPAPFYSHWFSTPSSFNGTEWFHGLAVHEGRHMVQFDKMKDGAGKYTWRVLGGANGTAALIGLYLPMWFLEGDAVVTETALTGGGRGRMPHFTMWHRALELEGKRYPYYRAYLGTRGDAWPYADFYRLGWLMVSHVRRHYGADVFNRVLERTGKYFIFENFDTALQAETGRSIVQIYNDTMDEYYRLWKKQQRGIVITDSETLTPRKKGWGAMLYPRPAGNGSVIAVRWSKNDMAELVNIKKNGRCRSFRQVPVSVASHAFHNERGISAGGGKVLWRETLPDPRWGYRTWSNLVVYDMHSGKKQRITERGKFLSSTISHNGKSVVGIFHGPDLVYRLMIIDAATGKKLKEHELGRGTYYFDPAFDGTGKAIIASSLTSGGYSLVRIDADSGEVKKIIPEKNGDCPRSPFVYKRYIFYSSDYSGIDNIYCYDMVKKERYQVTSRPCGAFHPSVSSDGKFLLFNDYTTKGYRAARMPLTPEKWIPIEEVKVRRLEEVTALVKQEAGRPLDDESKIPRKAYEVRDYSPLKNSINIYGWMPLFDMTNVDFRFTIQSLDVMQTTAASVSYVFNMNEKTHAGEGLLIYQGIYPVLYLGGGYGQRAGVIEEKNNPFSSVMMRWNEGRVFGGAYVPQDYSRGIHNVFLTLGFSSGYTVISDKNKDNYSIYNMYRDGDLHYFRYSLSLLHYLQYSGSAIGPRWGESLSVSYRHTPFYGDFRGGLLSAGLKFFLPGIGSTHNIELACGYEKQDPGNYWFSSSFFFPRGYDFIYYRHFVKGSIDYNLPLFDLGKGAWDLVYIKRFLGALYFDYGYGHSSGVKEQYRSVGAEILAECNFLANTFISASIGVRYSYCIDSNEHVVEAAFRSLVPAPYYRGRLLRRHTYR